MPTFPPHPDITIPDISLSDFVLRKCLKLGDAVALVDNNSDGELLTCKQIYEDSRECGAFLYKHGIRKGDVVGICAGGRLEFPIAMLGILACGATVAPCNPEYKEGEILGCFETSEPKAVFVEDTIVEILKKVKEKLPCIKTLFVMGRSDEFTTFDSMIDENPGNLDVLSAIEIDPYDDLAMLPYSSGTTGLPKSVMLSHKNLVGMCCMASMTIGCHEEEHDPVVGYVDRPMFHGGGSFNVLMTLAAGAKLVIDKEREVDEFVKAIQKHKVTHLLTVPSTLIRLANRDDTPELNMPSLKSLFYAGAALAPDVARRLSKRFNVKIGSGYGMTECPGIAINCHPDINLETVGYPCPTVELKIVDINTGELCEPLQDGEILVRGPQTTKGYLKNPEANKKAFDKDGWFRTGDIGHLDNDGLLYFVGRLKEVIKYKSIQVAPAELESVILKHPKVADVGVIGFPNPVDGELPKAFVVRKDSSVSAKDIEDLVKGELVDYKQLRGGIEFVDAIPKTVTGKIHRAGLKQMAGLD